MTTRRELLHLIAGSALAAACRSNARSEPARRSGARSAAERPGASSPVSQLPATVAIARATDHAEALTAALALAGGLPSVTRGQLALIKVNSNSGDPYPYSSSPTAVALLGARLHGQGARVLVGDRSFWGDDDTAGNLEASGVGPVARAVGAEVVAFDDDTTDWVRLDDALVPNWVPPVHVPRVAVEAACFLNLASCKTHFISGCTLALKNLLGLVRAADRARPGNLRSHDPERLPQQIADLHRALRPHLHVIDAHTALVAGGPTPGSGATSRFATPHIILASTDPVALDAAGIALLRRHVPGDEAIASTPPWQQPNVRAAAAVGGFAAGPGDVKLLGDATLLEEFLEVTNAG